MGRRQVTGPTSFYGRVLLAAFLASSYSHFAFAQSQADIGKRKKEMDAQHQEAYVREAIKNTLKTHYDPQAKLEVVDRVIAIVGESIVTERELEDKARLDWQNLAEVKDQAEREKKRRFILQAELDRIIANNLIDAELVKYRDKLGVTDIQVDKSFEEMARANNVDVATLTEWLRQNGKTVPEQKKEIRRELEQLQLLQFRMQGKNTMSDKELSGRCAELQIANKNEVVLHLRHILVNVAAQAGMTDEQKARKKIEAIHKRLAAGEDFMAVLKQTSEDTRAPAGDLGDYQQGSIPEIDEALFKLKTGEFSAPLRTNLGYHIFRVEDKKQGASRPGCEDPNVKNRIMMELSAKEMERHKRSWVDELRAKAYIDVRW